MTTRRRNRWKLVSWWLIVVLGSPGAAASQSVKPTTQPPAPKGPAKGSSGPAIPRMSEGLVQAALRAWDGASTAFTGLSESDGDSTKLYVSSSRQMIARKGYELAGTTGKYNPPASMRTDVVSILCGDNDRSEQFDCVSIKVLVGTRAVKPLTYRAANDTYQNAFGAKWRAKDVIAMYSAAGLEKGFSVEYASDDGVTWTYEVTPELAAKELLLTLKPLE